MDALSNAIVLLNQWGRVFCDFAGRMLIQSSILVGLLLLADLCLRARVSARFRYGIWLLVLVKLVLPPSLALPTGVNYWLSRYLPVASPAPAASLLSPLTPAVSLTRPAYVNARPGVVAVPAATEEIAAAGGEIVPLQWPGLALLGWVTGILLLLALVSQRIASARRSLRRSHPAGQQMVGLLEECCAYMGVTARVTLRLTTDLHSPAVCGFLRPVILLPASVPPRLWPEGLRTILIHELAHIKRRDPWVSLAQTALQIAYFWHPLVWVANTKLRDLREFAVDETVVATCRSGAHCYTETLIDIAQMAFRKPAFSLRLIGIAESKRALERRIKHMLNRRILRGATLGPAGLLVILAAGAMLIPMGRGSVTALAQQPAAQSVPELPAGIAELFGIGKDAVLEKFGEPERIDGPFMIYDDLSFGVEEGTVVSITLVSPRHAFGNGIRVGDSEEKVKGAFGPDWVLKETDAKDFLIYEALGVNFEIDKGDRSVMEVNIDPDYGDAARLAAYPNAVEFEAQLPQKVAGLDIDSADLNQVIVTFGQPVKYIWGSKVYSSDQLPDRFIAVYPGDFRVFMMDNRIVELRFERKSKYAYAGKLRIGSTLEEALAVLGAPVKTVEGEPIGWSDSDNVLFKDIDGRKGHCYYHRPDRGVRVWFGDYKVAGIYMTRSDFDDGGKMGPFDPEFARLLPQRIALLDIDSADLEKVREIFGEPMKYLWGDKTFKAEALPDNYCMDYPCGFSVWMTGNRIVEIRHERTSPYVYRNKLRIGSTLEEALALLGEPTETVTGQKNTFKENVLYKDIEGRKGHCYYHRPDQAVRIWFGDYKVWAIYMTRSDYHDGSDEPFDAEFAALLPGRVAALDIDLAGLEQVREIFGEPMKYVWGNQTFTADALPDRYIMSYPCGFCVFMMGDRIMEIRHERHRGGSPFVYRGTLRIGSSMDEAVALLGEPTETVVGKKLEFKDGVLYKDIDGDEGHGYYHRSDQNVRIFFWEGKVIAIYMTRSDYPAR